MVTANKTATAKKKRLVPASTIGGRSSEEATVPVFGCASLDSSGFIEAIRGATPRLRFQVHVDTLPSLEKPPPGSLLILTSAKAFSSLRASIPAGMVVVVLDSPLYLVDIEGVVALDFDAADPWALGKSSLDLSGVVECLRSTRLGKAISANYSTMAAERSDFSRRLRQVVTTTASNSLLRHLNALTLNASPTERKALRSALCKFLTGGSYAEMASSFASAFRTPTVRPLGYRTSPIRPTQDDILSYLKANEATLKVAFRRGQGHARSAKAALAKLGFTSFETTFIEKMIADSMS